MPALPPDRPGCPNAPGGRRPLPDPAAIQLFLIPESAPPYDEDVPAGETGGGRLPARPPHGAERGYGAGQPEGRTARDGIGPRDRGAGQPEGRTARDGIGPRDRGAGQPEGRTARDGMGPRDRGAGQPEGRTARDGTRGVPRRPATVPGAPPGWPGQFAQVLAETLAGARPPRQIVPWTTEEALRRIQRLGPRLASQQRPRVRRVLTSLPAPDVMEMTVVVGFGPRVRALAVRLEQTGPCPAAPPGARAAARWVCTAVEAA